MLPHLSDQISIVVSQQMVLRPNAHNQGIDPVFPQRLKNERKFLKIFLRHVVAIFYHKTSSRGQYSLGYPPKVGRSLADRLRLSFARPCPSTTRLNLQTKLAKKLSSN